MNKLLLPLLLFSISLCAQFQNADELLRAMHKKYSGNYCRTIVFDQRTTRYDTNGVVKDSSYWYEWISYPDKFRIDFGKKHGGNCVIFKNDSAFNFRNNKLVNKRRDENDLLLLLGGMYYRPIDSVVARLERLGYDLDKYTRVKKNKYSFYVISSKDNKLQFWVDQKDLKVVKIQTVISEKDILEISFDAFKKTCKGFTETKVTGYKNGKLEQKEEYLHLQTEVLIPDSIFNKK